MGSYCGKEVDKMLIGGVNKDTYQKERLNDCWFVSLDAMLFVTFTEYKISFMSLNGFRKSKDNLHVLFTYRELKNINYIK